MDRSQRTTTQLWSIQGDANWRKRICIRDWLSGLATAVLRMFNTTRRLCNTKATPTTYYTDRTHRTPQRTTVLCAPRYHATPHTRYKAAAAATGPGTEKTCWLPSRPYRPEWRTFNALVSITGALWYGQNRTQMASWHLLQDWLIFWEIEEHESWRPKALVFQIISLKERAHTRPGVEINTTNTVK